MTRRRAVWAHLEAQPGFNEAIREGERQIRAGQSVRFSEVRQAHPIEPDPTPLELLAGGVIGAVVLIAVCIAMSLWA